MIKFIEESEIKSPNFISDGRIFLVRCIDCKAENYAMAVATGRCVWCGTQYKLKEK